MATVLRSQARVVLPIFFGCEETMPMRIKSWDILSHDLQVLPVKSYNPDDGILEIN